MYYAQLKNNKVHTICQLNGDHPNLVKIDSFDASKIGAYYIPESNTFDRITLTVDKSQITADGIDSCVFTAHIPSVIPSVDFIIDGQIVQTSIPVNQEATLTVSATKTGKIKVSVDGVSAEVEAV